MQKEKKFKSFSVHFNNLILVTLIWSTMRKQEVYSFLIDFGYYFILVHKWKNMVRTQYWDICEWIF